MNRDRPSPPADELAKLPELRRMTSARLPTPEGEFRLALYRSDDGKDHLALVLGDVAGKSGVVARIHSECFTGDVLGSLRCDCGEQLERALRIIAAEGRGILIYLRQEGRGIGLLQKLRAYNLQDAGYDTVEANLELGHQADERDYGAAVAILRDQGVESVRLLTNNPTKLEGLVEHGFSEVERIPLEIPATPENAGYLETKVRRMRHLLDLDSLVGEKPDAMTEALVPGGRVEGRPSVTLTWAQSLDGSITFRRGKAMALSCPEALELTHGMRARHDGILVGIGTVLADDPRLTVRLVEGHDPQPIVLDGELRLPPEAELLRSPRKTPWVVTTDDADPERQLRLEQAGARVIRLPEDERGLVDLHVLLARLDELGIRSLMVEGGSQVITSFLRERLVDRLVLTVAPLLVGGLGAVGRLETDEFPELVHTRYRWVGSNLVLTGEVRRHREEEIDDELLRLGGAL